MNTRRSSIKRTLLLWLVSALFALSALFIATTYVVERIMLEHDQNGRLEQIARAIPPNLKQADVRAINVKLHHGPDDFLLQIWDGGAEIYRSHDDLRLPRFSVPGFSIESWGGQRWKVYVRRAQGHTIQVAQSLQARAAIARGRALHTMVPLLLFIPVIGLCIPLCIDRALRSLNQLSGELHGRSAETLAPVSRGDQPAEIVPLTEALDTLFHRLREASDRQRKFIADASHELRTPLATLQVQTQVVEQSLGPAQQRAALEALKAGIKRTSHLAEQLLLTSQLESAAPPAAAEVLRLDHLARDVIMDLLPFSVSKDIDLGMGRTDPATVTGSGYQLRLLVRNLIDNAIRYTPRGGRVDVAVEGGLGGVSLVVADSGPGIPPQDHDRVFDRFYRCLGHDTPGSGLGLAIVKQVAVQHEAQIRLDRSAHLAGLEVTVRFPQRPA
ncbi:two-component sensor histidine kinase [Phenylobacterium hankyongense]|uniref:histidine kinase n=1 Tax=Phenylobacterium hankyongense TaxID=1813876 RepID=A0A328B8Q6_9CAUL|nr:ATP-binding protein [Phenylobacterium hankyongense]RAK61378.1 two-component sensor histidine kinase [Phenylobacterium hankyongense]